MWEKYCRIKVYQMIHLRGEILEKLYVSALNNCALFDGVEVQNILDVIGEEYDVNHYSNNETVYTRSKFNDSIGIVLDGSVEVYKDETKTVMLNRIGKGGFFGAAALFADKKEYVSVIIAKGNCTVLLIPFEQFRSILAANSVFAVNYIKFLSGRIEFLNKKIDEFTAPDACEKLSRYLLDKASNKDGKTVCQVKSMVELSKILNMGRASLYRSFDELEQEKIITRDGKTIVVDDLDKLKKRGI